VRTAEVTYIGNASDLIRANERAKASTAATAAAIAASGKTASQSYFTMAGASKKAAGELEHSHNKMASSMAGIRRSSTAATAGIVAVGAAAYGIKKSADTLAELAKETRTLHNVTGLSVGSASAYAAVAKAQDVPVKALNMSFGTLSKQIHAVENAHSGATKAASKQELALKQLGLPMSSITRAHGDLNKLLPQITKRFEEMPGGISKTNAGMTLFGKGWQTLVPLMHKGALGLSEQLKVAKEMGATLSGSTAQQVAQYAKEQEKARYATLGLQVAVGEYLAPALTKLIRASADVTHSLADGVHWLEKHKAATEAAAVALGLAGLGGGLVYASSKAKKFIAATQDMVSAAHTLASKVGLYSKGVEGSFAGQATAAEGAAAKTAAAQDALATKVGAADGKIEAANAKAAKSFGKMIPVVVAVALAVEALNKILPKGDRPENLFGGNQPGEAEREGEVWAKKHGGFGTQKNLNTGGGIMGYFMARGLTPAQAAGIVGNLQQESSLNPKTNTPEGIGLASWHDPGRIAALKDFAKKQHKSWEDINVQLDFIWKELSGGGLAAVKAAKNPSYAARAFNRAFEGGTDPSGKREKFAEEAFRAHPQHHSATQKHTAAMEKHSKSLGYYESAAHKAAKHRAKKVADLSSQIDRWAEHSVGKFAESWGKNTGPELDKLQKEFHTKAAAWCAEFATTAAMMGGANKAVRTASVATIREWAEQGSHGYRKGVGHTPHVGDLMMMGNEHVGFVQSVHGGKVTTIEGNTSAGKVATRTHSASEGTYASPLYHNLKTGKVLLDRASKGYEEAVKRAEHLLLTGGQKATLHGFVKAAGGFHATAMQWGGAASSVGEFLEARQAKWALDKPDLTTAAGQKTAHDRDEQAVLTKRSQKKYYERELRALQAEAKQFAKARDGFRKIARHQHNPHAKKEALDKAAGFQARLEQAQAAAKELGGSIASTELAITEAEHTLDVVLPEEIAQSQGERQSGDLNAYEAANSKVDAEVRAKLLTPEQGVAAKKANAERAQAGGFGELSPEGALKVKGDIVEFGEALTNATSAVEAHTQAVLDATKAELEKAQAARAISEVESGTLLKAIADLISGQIGGVDYHGRQMTAGAGTAAKY
jgi:Phage tail lysozyme/CHAP domain